MEKNFPIRNLTIVFVNYSDQTHSGLFQDNFVAQGYHTDVFDELEIKLSLRIIALVCTRPGVISHLAVVRKSTKVASKKMRVKFENITEIASGISLDEIVHSLDEKTRQLWSALFEEVSTPFQIVSGIAWNGLISYARTSRQDFFEQFGKAFSQVNNIRNVYTENSEVITAFEKDALIFALKTSNFDQHISGYGAFDVSTSNTPEFLSKIQNFAIREDVMILHDSKVFDGWDIVCQNQLVTTFQSGTRKLSVMYANRLPLEETFGVDLIYIDDKNKSFIMIQYKRLARGEEKVYRPASDSNYEKEVALMEKYSTIEPNNSDGYRFNSEMFYFKLCRDTQPSLSRDLIDGMYIPYAYWKTLLESDDTTGPRGGKYLSYDNVENYFNNSDFTSLMSSGLIGSERGLYDYIASIVRETIEGGNSIIVSRLEQVIVHELSDI
jgi:hypothetical protein